MTDHHATPDAERKRQLIALARANLARAKAALCGHGVTRKHCTQAHESEEA